jgi:hypothetical protein
MNSREKLIKKTEEKVGKIPKRYIPEELSIPDLKKQLKSIEEEKDRPKVKSFKSKKSSYTMKAKNYFGEGNTNKEKMAEILSKGNKNREKEIFKGLDEIFKKGEGAYYSSGSRPNQTPQSWAFARVFSVLFGGNARQIDKIIVDKYDLPLLK